MWDEYQLDADEVIGRAHGFLRLMDDNLSARPWLAAEQPTIADLAHYAYIAHAPVGNVDVSGYRHIRYWLNSVKRIPGFVSLSRNAAGLLDAASTNTP